jgi:hypothetical protein
MNSRAGVRRSAVRELCQASSNQLKEYQGDAPVTLVLKSLMGEWNHRQSHRLDIEA